MKRIGWRSIGVVAFWAAVTMLVAGCNKGSKVTRHLQRGDEFAAKADYLKAEIEYLNVHRLEPGNPHALRQLGEVYFQQGNFQKSFIFLKRSSAIGQADEAQRIKLSQIYLTGRKFSEARTEANAILATRPNCDEALIILGQTAVASNDVQATMQELEKLRPQSEQAAGFHLALGILALRQDDLAAAEVSFNRAVTLAPKLSVAHEMVGQLQLRQHNAAGGGQSLKIAAELAPIRSATPLRYVAFLRETGDEAGALQRIEELVRQAPDYIPASVQLADLLFGSNRQAECATVVKRVLAMDPTDYEALLLHARLKMATGELAQGLEELEKLSRIHAGVPAAHYYLALAQLLQRDQTKALISLGQAVRLDPDYADALLLQADLNLQKGDTEAVINMMQRLVGKQPQLGRAYVILGDALARRGRSAEALETYKRLARLFPKNPQAPFLIGSLQRKTGNFVAARQAFEEARVLGPDHYAPFEQLTELDLNEQKFSAALARAEAEITRKPKAAESHYLQAKVFYAQANLPQAEASLRQAIECAPESTTGATLLAKILSESDRGLEALALLRQVKARNSNDCELLLQIGILEESTGNALGARQAYDDALKINPNFWPALNNLAVLYAEKLQQLDPAYETARQARELVENEPIVADTFGWILYHRREYRWALSLLQFSAQKLTEEPEVFYHLGVVQYQLGDEAGARSSFTKATTLAKPYRGREDAARRLRLLSFDFNRADAEQLAELTQQLANNPSDQVLAGRLGALEEKKGNFTQALAIYERAIAADKSNASATARAARIYADQRKEPQKALELAKAARRAAPDDPILGHLIGATAYTAGDATWAVTLLLESSRQRPNEPELLFDLALAQYAVGDLPASETTMKRAIGSGQGFPRLEAGRRWLTNSSLFKDPVRLQQCGEKIEEWLKADPDSPAILMAHGAFHELQSNPASAEKIYVRLLDRHPAFWPAAFRLATIQSSRNELLPQAAEVATSLRQARPDDPDIAALLGTIAYKQGDFRRAAQLLGECSRQRSEDPVIWYYLGLAQHHLKKADETRRTFDRLLTLESTGERAVEARRILAELK